MSAPCIRVCTIFATEVLAGARIFALMPAAAAYAATDEPPLPELSSSTSVTPRSRRKDIITVVPRSLKLAVGLNHSGLTSIGNPATSVASIGVHPSPSDTGRSKRTGRAARYRHCDRSARSTSSRVIPPSGEIIRGEPSSPRHRVSSMA